MELVQHDGIRVARALVIEEGPQTPNISWNHLALERNLVPTCRIELALKGKPFLIGCNPSLVS